MFLDQARSKRGGLSTDSRRKIMTFMNQPTVEAWDEISGLVICWDETASGLVVVNIWQAVIALDRKWAHAATMLDSNPMDWNSLPPEYKWEEFPDPITTARAIQAATAVRSKREPRPKRR